MNGFTETVVEEAALAWLEAFGYAVLHGPDISPESDTVSWPSPKGKWRTTATLCSTDETRRQ